MADTSEQAIPLQGEMSVQARRELDTSAPDLGAILDPRELRHRTDNFFAVLIAIVRLTARHETDAASMRES